MESVSIVNFDAFRSVLINKGAILIFIKLASAVLAFVFHVLLARELSVEEFGLFSLALSCLIFSTAFAKQGFESTIVRYFAQQDAFNVKALYLSVLFFSFINCLIIGCILIFFADFISVKMLNTDRLGEIIPIVAILTALQTWLAINSSALKGREFSTSSMMFAGGVTYTFAISLLLLYNPTSAIDALHFFLVSVFIATLLSFITVKLKLKLNRPLQYFYKSTLISQFRKTSNILFVSALSSLFMQQFSILVLAKYTTLTDVALYNIALKISLLISYPLLVLNTLTAPKYAKLYASGDISSFKKLALLTTKGLILIATFLCIIISIFAEEIVVFFGEQYRAAADVLIILAIGQWFNLATGSVVSMLVMSSFENVHRTNSIVFAIVTILAMFFFVPLYGLYAAAWVTTISLALFNVVSWFFVNRFIYSKV